MLYLLRQIPVKTLKHLPKFLPKDNDFKNTALICDDEHEKLRLAILDVKDQFFVETATWGLDLWEKILDIPINYKLDYGTRRARILSKINSNVIVSREFFTNLINLFIADKLGKIIEHPENYSVDILVPDNKVLSFKDLDEAIRIFIPAHLSWKYIAFAESKGYFYLGGIVSICKTINIRANSEFNININGITKNNTIGIVHIAKIINISANYYE